MVESSSLVNEIDITNAAKPWRWVRIAEYFMVVVCSQLMVGTVVVCVTFLIGAVGYVWWFWALQALAIGIPAANLVLGWWSVGVIDLRYRRTTILALFLLVLLSGLTIYLLKSDPTEIGLIFFQVFIALGALVGIIGLLRVGWSRIRDIKMSFKEFMAKSNELKHAHRLAKGPPARGRYQAIAFAAGGFTCLFIGAIPNVVLPPDAPPLGLGLSLLSFLGWFSLLHSRVFLQPDFEQLKATDNRQPVVFLRSFADDEKQGVGWQARGIVTLSLEARLAMYFNNFGPFIAVESRSQRAMKHRMAVHLGAAVVQLKDDEWQSVVHEWIQRASIIVMFAGLTEAVNWELNELITNNKADRLLLIFREKSGRRLDRIKNVFASTPWSTALNQIVRPASLRVITFDENGKVTVVRCRTGNRDSYHLAAMVAHFLKLTNEGAARSQGV